MDKKMYFTRRKRKYTFLLYEDSSTLLTTITESCAPISISDTIRIKTGEFKGVYEVVSINPYSNVYCRLTIKK